MAIVEYEVSAPVERSAPAEILTDAEKRARTLEAAALEIEVRGHSRRTYEEYPGGPVCLVGAVGVASSVGRNSINGNIDGYQADEAAKVAFGRTEDTQLVYFNDEHSAQEVTFLLRWRAEEIRDGWDA